MKTTKTNHSEILNSLKAEYTELSKAYEVAVKDYQDAREEGRLTDEWDKLDKIGTEKRRMESKMKYHSIMAQDKIYATQWIGSDAHAYEVIEVKNDKLMTVRRMKATIKESAKKALQDSFTPGGFCGHFDNELQEWDYATDESNPIETIRKREDGRWYTPGSCCHFSIMAEPYERYDYNF